MVPYFGREQHPCTPSCTYCPPSSPRQLFLLPVPGGTLELLRHTPGVKKDWQGEGHGGRAAVQGCCGGTRHCRGPAPCPPQCLAPTPVAMCSCLMVAVARFGKGEVYRREGWAGGEVVWVRLSKA